MNLSKSIVVSAVTASLLSSSAMGNAITKGNNRECQAGNCETWSASGDINIDTKQFHDGSLLLGKYGNSFQNLISKQNTVIVGNIKNIANNGVGIVNGVYGDISGYPIATRPINQANVTIEQGIEVEANKFGLTSMATRGRLSEAVFGNIVVEQGGKLHGGEAGIGNNQLQGFTINSLENNGTISGSSGIKLGALSGPAGIHEGGNHATIIKNFVNNADGIVTGITGVGGKIENFENKGTIQRSTGSDIAIGGRGHSIDESKNQVRIFNFKNSGLIEGNVGLKDVKNFTTEANQSGQKSKINGNVVIYGSNEGLAFDNQEEIGGNIKVVGGNVGASFTNNGSVNTNATGGSTGDAIIVKNAKGEIEFGSKSNVKGGVHIDKGSIANITIAQNAIFDRKETTENPNPNGFAVTGATISGDFTNAGTIKDKVLIGDNWGQNTTINGKFVNTGAIGGDITDDNASIEIGNGSSIQRGFENSGTINKNIQNSGTITGGLTNSGSSAVITGDIVNNGSITGGITNEKTIGGNIVNNGTLDSITNNAQATIGGITNNSNNGTTEIANSGEITNGVTNAGSGTTAITNNGNATIGAIANTGAGTTTIDNKQGGTIDAVASSNGKIELDNSGNITGGVVADGGNLDFTNKETGTIGGAITNNGNGELVLNQQSNTAISQAITNAGGGNLVVNNSTGKEISGAIKNSGTGTTKIENDGTLSGKVENVGGGKTTINNKANGSITTGGISSSNGELELNNSGNVSGKVEASNDGNLVVNNNKTISGGIENKGSGETTIVNNDGGTIEQGVKNSGTGTTSVTNKSGGGIQGGITSTGGTTTIDNQQGGTIDAVTSTAGKIELGNSGNITGKVEANNGDLDFTNNTTGSVTGGVVNSGSGKLDFTNNGAGTIGQDGIVNSGTGELEFTNNSNDPFNNTIKNTNTGSLIVNNEAGKEISGDITNSGNGDATITNKGNGTISSTITGTGGKDLIVKNEGSGEISSTITGGSGTTKVENIGGGTISSEITGGSGKTEITNTSGTISGTINGGQGDLIVKNSGAGSKVTGTITGANGKDLTINNSDGGNIKSEIDGSKSDNVIVKNDNGVIDSVITGGSGTTNIENTNGGTINKDIIAGTGSTTIKNNTGSNISGDITGNNTGKLDITNTGNLSGTITGGNGGLNINNGIDGNIKAPIIAQGGSNTITNSGTINDKIKNQGGKLEVTNNDKGVIKGDIDFGDTGGTINNEKGGSLNGSIIVGSGDVTIKNDGAFKPDNNKPHIENSNGSGKVNINGWDTTNSGQSMVVGKGETIEVAGSIKGPILNGTNVNAAITDKNGKPVGDKINNGAGLVGAIQSGIVQLEGSGTGIETPTLLPDGTILNKINMEVIAGPVIGANAMSSFNTRLTSTQGTLKEFSIKNFKSSVNASASAKDYTLKERVALLEKVRKGQDYEKALEVSDTYMLSQYENAYPIVAAATFSASDVIIGGALNPDVIIGPSVKGYTDEDLMMSLDYIFNKQENDSGIYTFAVPYGNITQDKSSGTRTDSNTYGVLVGVQGDLKGYGILGFYGGYEIADRENSAQKLETDDKSFMAGVTYYNAFARSGTNEFYVNIGTSIGNTSSDLLMIDNLNYKVNTSFDTLNLGADLRFGANIYNVLSNSILSPEIGVIYSRLSSDAFELKHKEITEKYDATDIDLLEATLGLRYHRALNQRSKFTLSGGGKAKLWDSADASGQIFTNTNHPISPKDTIKLDMPDAYFYGHVGYTHLVGKNAEISFNYQGSFAKDIQSHTGFIRFGYWW